MTSSVRKCRLSQFVSTILNLTLSLSPRTSLNSQRKSNNNNRLSNVLRHKPEVLTCQDQTAARQIFKEIGHREEAKKAELCAVIHISTNNKGNESICFLPLQELLGDRLLTSPHRDGETSLPSPNQLRHKIILKNKKLRPAKKTSATTTAIE